MFVSELLEFIRILVLGVLAIEDFLEVGEVFLFHFLVARIGAMGLLEGSDESVEVSAVGLLEGKSGGDEFFCCRHLFSNREKKKKTRVT
jgi:hypothetical protein